MSSRRYRPRRRLRSEIIPLAVILTLPAALVFAFPSGAVDFRCDRRPEPVRVYNAFVSLDAGREAELLAAARSSWQSDSSRRRGVRANLLSLMDSFEGTRVASGLVPSLRPAVDPVEEYEETFLPTRLAAEDPRPLSPAEESAPAPAFPESDLLKLN